MRTRLLQYDLCQPALPAWGLEGYQQAWVLVRAGRRPLGLLRLGLQPWQTTLEQHQLDHALREQPGPLHERLASLPGQQPVDHQGEPLQQLPPISIIVCTRDRPRALARCLRALQRLDYPDYEVVVVDNASRDEATARVVAATPFRYVREPRPGLDWARNRGLAAARHELVAYVDDDAQADRGWLLGVAEAFADPSVAAVTGLVLPVELETEAQHLFERYGGMGKGFTPRRLERASLGALGVAAAHAAGVGANMAFRRRTLLALGGFDTALDVGTPAAGGGDLDMFHRVLAAGLCLRYEPGALVWHQHRRDLAGLERQLYCNGRSYGVFLLKMWRCRSLPRGATARYALRWAGGWVLGRLARGLVRRETFPLRLLWAEARGALHAPWAYLATYRADRRLRSAAWAATDEHDPARRTAFA